MLHKSTNALSLKKRTVSIDIHLNYIWKKSLIGHNFQQMEEKKSSFFFGKVMKKKQITKDLNEDDYFSKIVAYLAFLCLEGLKISQSECSYPITLGILLMLLEFLKEV